MTADPGDGLLPGGLPGTVYSFRWAVIGHRIQALMGILIGILLGIHRYPNRYLCL